MTKRDAQFTVGVLLVALAAPVLAIGYGDALAAAKSVLKKTFADVGTGEVAVKNADGTWSGASPGGTISTTGDGLSGDGSAGDPLAVASDLENLVDALSVSTDGTITGPSNGGFVIESFAGRELFLAGAYGEGAADGSAVTLAGGGSDSGNGGNVLIEAGDSGSGTDGTISFVTGAASRLRVTATGVLEATSSNTNPHALGFRLVIESNATSNTITAAEASPVGGYVFTDDGTDNNNTSANELPACVAGLVVRGYCRQGDADDILALTAVGDDTIRVGGSVTAAAGTVHLKETGSSVTLLGINSTEWVSLGGEGNVYFP